MGLVLDLLHAHRVSPIVRCTSRLNLFAIRTCFTPSVRKSAEPAIDGLNSSPFKHIKKRVTNVTLFLIVGDGT